MVRMGGWLSWVALEPEVVVDTTTVWVGPLLEHRANAAAWSPDSDAPVKLAMALQSVGLVAPWSTGWSTGEVPVVGLVPPSTNPLVGAVAGLLALRRYPP